MSWIVVFTDSLIKRRWWDVFTKENYRHVLVMGYDVDHETWILLDWGADRFDAHLLKEGELVNLIAFIQKHGWEAYKVPQGTLGRNGPRFPFWPFWCTDAVKHIVGIRSWAVTPWQLRQHMRRKGYERTFQDGCGRTDQNPGTEQGPAGARQAAGA